MRIKVARVVLAVLTAALVTACAGGGGGGGGIAVSPPPAPPPPLPPPPPPPPPSPPGSIPTTASSEYNVGFAVADTKVITAWQNGATGQGVLVGVIDDGVQATHPELAGRISPLSTDIVPGRNQLFDVSNTHGSELSAIIAGNFNNDLTVGLAFNATVLAVRADNGADGFAASALTAAVDYAIAQGVKVINFSLGSSTPSASNFQAAIQRATSAGIIIVASAGNDGPNAPDPNYPGFLATTPSVANNLIVIAGAHDRNGNIVSFSNRAGQAQNFFLTAPGLEIIVPDFGDPGGPAGFQVCPPPAGAGGIANTCRVQGTSYSAPYVTGGIAVLLSAFPSLTPQQTVQLLLQSADDAGVAGIDAEYGRGRMNLARAFQPVGTLSMPLAAGLSVTPSTPLGVTGGAFGDGVAPVDPGIDLWRTVGFDDLGRTFSVDLRRNWLAGSRLAALPSAPSLWREGETEVGRMAFAHEDSSTPETLRTMFDARDVSASALRVETALSPDTHVTFAANAPALSSLSGGTPVGLLGFAGSDVAAAVTQSLGPDTRLSFTTQSGVGSLGAFGRSARRAFAARLAHDAGPVSAALTAGSLHETGAWLGLAWSPTLGAQPDGETGFVGLEGRWRPAPGLSLTAEGELGRSGDGVRGWLSVEKPLTTSAFALSGAVDVTPNWLDDLGATGRFTLSLRQPLRVEGGALAVSLPTATAYGRASLGYETRTFNPAPSGRELDLEAAYEVFVAGRLSARAGLGLAHEPGHVAGADPDARASLGLRFTY